jgi:pSer/pThr/pTyr-binding forkhead associated (FHA) protein
MVGNVALHLLDAVQGHRVQTWRFQDQSTITIGRGADNDINLADAQVSRRHVELVHRDAKWWLLSHGRNGTWMNGAMEAEACLMNGAVFQLGSNGPSFQFVTVNDSASALVTVDNLDAAALDFLAIDEQRRAEEVQQIADGEAFRELQEQARRLKSGHHADQTEV